MQAVERAVLRKSILKELYDFNFSNGGRYAVVRDISPEEQQAYSYLIEKGLVHDKKGVGLKISPYGIDTIEKDVDLYEV